jgi:hypothetical protein
MQKIELIKQRGSRFISGNYRSREEGIIRRLLNEFDIPTLQE